MSEYSVETTGVPRTIASSTTVVTVSPAVTINPAPAQRALTVNPSQQTILIVVSAVTSVVTTVGSLLALGWFGMWMGLTSRAANLATLKTLLFVQVIPWFVTVFASTTFVGVFLARYMMQAASNQPIAWMVWWPILIATLSTILALGKDFAFIIWSRKKLYSSLREQAVRVFDQPRFVQPPLLPVAIPPVIPTQP